MNKELLVGTAVITAAIMSISRRGKVLDDDVQHAGLSILKHVDEHGDTTLADKLVEALPKGARRLALVEWFVNFGKMRTLDRDNKDEALAIKAGRIFQHDKERSTNIAEATLQAWHTMRREAEPNTVFDAQSAVNNLLTRIRKAHENKLTIEGKAEALAELDALRKAIEEA